MSTANKTFKTLLAKNLSVEVFTERCDEPFLGFIREFNDKFLLLEYYNSEQIFAGIIVFKRSSIRRVRWEVGHERALHPGLPKEELTKKLAGIHIGSLENVIKSVDRTFGYVGIRSVNSDGEFGVIGKIREMDSSTLVVTELVPGVPSHSTMLMLHMQDIIYIDAGSAYANDLAAAYGLPG